MEIKDTHDYFKKDKDLFMNEKRGFIYRNSITMPILQIGEEQDAKAVESQCILFCISTRIQIFLRQADCERYVCDGTGFDPYLYARSLGADCLHSWHRTSTVCSVASVNHVWNPYFAATDH